MDLLNDLKQKYQTGNVIIKLIFINIAVFLIQFILMQFVPGFMNQFFAGTNSLWGLLMKPWSVITYQFMHGGILHLVFNMLWLYWFGQMFLYHFTQKQLLSVYLLGGLSGAMLFFVAYNLVPMLSSQAAYLVGASAAVTAIGVAIATYRPNLPVNLFLLGQVKIKYLVLVLLILDFNNIENAQNVGGHYSHLGGAIFGFFFGYEMKRGRDITKGFSQFMDWLFGLFGKRRKMEVSYRPTRSEREKDYNYNAKSNVSQAEIDRILEKISRSGYDSLTASEKEKLFKASK